MERTPERDSRGQPETPAVSASGAISLLVSAVRSFAPRVEETQISTNCAASLLQPVFYHLMNFVGYIAEGFIWSLPRFSSDRFAICREC
jgi:hypothetical protein